MPILGTATTNPSVVSPALSFTIKELSGDERILTLLGRALPYRPIEFPGTMRAQITYYAGNPIGTLQVLGAQEEQTTITGYWKDRFLQTVAGASNQDGAAELNGTPLANVGVIVQIVDDFRRKGQLVEVQWGTQIRHGIISKFTPKWHNVHDVEWEMQFSWISQGETDAAPTFAELDQQTVATDLQNASSLVTADVAATSFSAEDLYAKVVTLNSAVTAAAASATATVQKVAAQVLAPVNAATAMLGVLENAITSAQNLMVFTQGQVDRSIHGANLAAQNLGQTLTASSNLRKIRTDARSSRSLALHHRESLLRTVGLRAAPKSFTVRQGQDLRTVATLFYGSPNDWRRIALFNGLNGAQVSAGTVILIPPATSSATTS